MKVDKQSVEDGVREAEARPLDFNPSDRKLMVETSIATIERMISEGARQPEIEKVVSQFVSEFPFLFKMVMQPNYDKATLRMMLNMLNKIGDGSVSQHQGSVVVGGKLVDKYVKPDLK